MSTVIIGSGLAGYLLAKEFRQLNPSAPLCLITESDGQFYSKPLLSTALTHQKAPDRLGIATADDMAEELQAHIHTRTVVVSIDPEKKILHTQNENKQFAHFSYSQLILACGSRALDFSIQSESTANIFSVNSLEDYTLFRHKIAEKSLKKVVIIGAGLVGCEFANDLCNAGYLVHVMTLAAHPLEKLLPAQLGATLMLALSSMGVHWHFNADNEAVKKKVLEADLVLSAIGLRANTELAKAAGIAINRGITVNAYLETNIPSIYALGDCAEVNGHLMFYIAPLKKCVHALARTLVGQRTAVHYPPMPVSIKTPVCPTVVCSPPDHVQGEWVVSGEGQHLRALYYDDSASIRGFALTGNAIKERATLTNLLPMLF